jgi:hypothetical protein
MRMDGYDGPSCTPAPSKINNLTLKYGGGMGTALPPPCFPTKSTTYDGDTHQVPIYTHRYPSLLVESERQEQKENISSGFRCQAENQAN